MKIEKILLSACQHAEGLLVVIDVLRAFTTAAFAFSRGAREIELVGTVEEAFLRKERDPSVLLIGEVGGQPIRGFDFGNSPTEISRASLSGKRCVQRTSAGTQGVVLAKKAALILTSSFPVAEATVGRIQQLNPSRTTFVITGDGGEEDLALADYLEERLRGKTPDPAPYLLRVEQAPEGVHLLAHPACPPHYAEDIQLAVAIDKFPFAMQVFEGNILRPV